MFALTTTPNHPNIFHLFGEYSIPIAIRQPPAAATDTPNKLRPYTYHGVRLSEHGAAAGHAVGTCPFCSRDGKFSVEICTGLWRCLVCGTGTAAGGGNGLVFLRLIHQNAARDNVGVLGPFLGAVAKDRKLLFPETAAAWGVARASDGTWLLGGYGTDGRLDQVYRRIKGKLLPTPGIWPEGRGHALHLPAKDFDPARPNIVVCYSEDTEVLTRRGWVLFKELCNSDLVATYDKYTSLVKFEVPIARQVFDYAGDMINISAEWCDLLVTPDHRMLYKVANGREKIRIAGDIGINCKFPTCGTDESYNIPVDDVWAQLLVAFVADGCIRRGFDLEFSFYKDRKKVRLKELLTRVHIPYKVQSFKSSEEHNQESILIDRRIAPQFLHHCPDKTWTGQEVNWPLSARRAMLNELQFWDGDSSKNSIRYFTSKYEQADLVSRVAAISGYACHIRRKPPRQEGHSEEVIVSLMEKEWRTAQDKPNRIPYVGSVYCVTVSTGFIIVRRNGKTIVAGNCEGPWDGMALWEVWDRTMSNTNIVAVPGCTTWRDEWTQLCKGKCVTLLFDSDYPRTTVGGKVSQAGYDGMARVAKKLSGVAATVRYIKWGESGFDENKPSGYDVRDFLTEDR